MTEMIIRIFISLSVLVFSVRVCTGEETAPFADIKIEKPFQAYLLSNPLLMEVAGTKVILDEKGQKVLLSVASTVLKDSTPAERLRAEKVCRVKALTGLVAERKGIQIFHTETLNEKTQIVIDDADESGTSVSELLQITQTKVQGLTRDMPVIGRWRSKDGKVFYLAIGSRLNESGEVVKPGEDDED